MKKIILPFLLVLILSGCSTAQTEEEPGMVYTKAAMTVAVQLTQNATPEATSTPTLEPTITPTATLEPTSTPTVPIPTATWSFNTAGKATAPILLYFHVGDGKEDNLYYQWETNIDIPSNEFRHQMQVLKEAGYTSIPVSTLAEAIWFGAELPAKPVVITFDVITTGIYNKAFPIMQHYGFIGTLYVTAAQVNGEGVLTEAQIKEMIAAGWEIGSKGMTGVDLTQNYSMLSDEISGSRLRLEEKFGVPVKSFAYPYGNNDAEVGSRVSSWGYTSAAGIFNTVEHNTGTIYYLARYEVKNDWTIDNFINILPWKPIAVPTPETGAIQGIEASTTITP